MTCWVHWGVTELVVSGDILIGSIDIFGESVDNVQGATQLANSLVGLDAALDAGDELGAVSSLIGAFDGLDNLVGGDGIGVLGDISSINIGSNNMGML